MYLQRKNQYLKVQFLYVFHPEISIITEGLRLDLNVSSVGAGQIPEHSKNSSDIEC